MNRRPTGGVGRGFDVAAVVGFAVCPVARWLG